MEYLLATIILAINLLVGLSIIVLILKKGVLKLNTGYVLSLSYGLGVGSLSYIHFLWLAVGLNGDQRWVIDIFGLLAGIFIVARYCILNKSELSSKIAVPLSFWNKASGYWACAIGVIAVFYALRVSFKLPYGTGDAVTNWYPKARFIFFSDDRSWLNIFSEHLPNWMHSDYPLLLPISLVRGWTYFGDASYIYATLLHVSMFAAAIALLYFTILSVRDQKMALLGMLAFVVMPNAYFITSLQYSDIFLLYFLTAGISILCINDISRSLARGSVLMAVLFSGFAAWTKNEGWLIFLSILFSILLMRFFVKKDFRGLRSLVYFLALGISVPLLYKFLYAPSNDIVNSSVLSMFNLFFTSERTIVLLLKIKSVFIDFSLWYYTPIVLVVAFAFSVIRYFSGEIVRLQILLPIAGIVVGYIAALLIIPLEYDYEWFLRFSVHRILFQIYPCLIILAFCFTGTNKKLNINYPRV